MDYYCEGDIIEEETFYDTEDGSIVWKYSIVKNGMLEQHIVRYK